MTDLLFGFLLPHLSGSIYVGPGSVSANSAVASPGVFHVRNYLCATAPFLGQERRAIPWAIHYYISCWFLGCLTSPDLTMFFFHPRADPVHSRPLMLKHSFVASSAPSTQHLQSWSISESCHKMCHKQSGVLTQHWKEKHPNPASVWFSTLTLWYFSGTFWCKSCLFYDRIFVKQIQFSFLCFLYCFSKNILNWLKPRLFS